MADQSASQEFKSDSLVFNGIDGASGAYLLPEMTPGQISSLAMGFTLAETDLDEINRRVEQINNPHAGVEADQRDLAETGWGVIFASDASPDLVEALAPLLDLRRQQAGERFKVYSGADGYFAGESKLDFLTRHDMGPGPANPDKVPYYLLIVGSPQIIPFSFQYQLDVQYAVGRIDFESLDDYVNYARSVVLSERDNPTPPRAAFFGVQNADDRATQLSSEYLVKPLAQSLQESIPQWAARLKKAAPSNPLSSWQIETVLGEQATKTGLSQLLENAASPGLFFSASHGIAFPNGHEKQLPQQGALICSDWPGPQLWRGALSEDHYFSAGDLSSNANLLGTIGFFFACYGAGTPREDEFARQIWSDQPDRREIAPRDFVARLPQRMLSLPKGGALAVVGHVERAWGVSFLWGQAGPQIQVFQDCLERLIKGNYPIGYALEVFNNRYAELSSDLSSRLNEIRNFFKKPDDRILSSLWTANNDARNYILLGDPAVRLNIAGNGAAVKTRETLPAIVSTPDKTRANPPETPAGVIPLPESAGQTPPNPQPEGAAQAVDYGLIDSFKQAQTGLSTSLQNFVSRLGDFLGKALDEATSLEVATYVSEQMDTVKYENGQFRGARLRALTRIEIDGDTLVCVPEEDGEVDTELWKIHMEMTRQAQDSRAELLKSVVSLATGLVDIIKP
jgi:hypothetical protein